MFRPRTLAEAFRGGGCPQDRRACVLVPAAEQVTVRREWRHLDLVLEVAGSRSSLWRMENKVFSLPDEDQLLRYGAIAGSLPGTPSLVLLSLTDPGWRIGTWALPGGGTWTYRSYASLAAALAASCREHQPR